MFKKFADHLSAHIDEICRRWVDELRKTARTEVHNQLLSSDIINGVKGMLANLAGAIAAQEAPDRETVPIGLIDADGGSRSAPVLPQSKTTHPLDGPLARAQNAAASHGILRHTQGAELHELLLEYIKLRQAIWSAMRDGEVEGDQIVTIELVQYVDRLFDELMLSSIESFFNVSVSDLEKRAVRDSLTGLYNKEYFQQRLNHEMRLAARHTEPLTVAMIDMDLLKSVNDTYGHQAGDIVISAVASAIRNMTRKKDIACRYGGDEFAVILPETGKMQAHIFAGRVISSVESMTIVVGPGNTDTEQTPKPIKTSGDAAKSQVEVKRGALVAPVPTLSIGLASFPEDARSPETLIAKADLALYQAKREGRNRIAG